MEGRQNEILECGSTKLGTICKLKGTIFVWLQQTLAFLSNCVSIKPAQLLAPAIPMAILAWSTATFLYTSKCSFFHQSKYKLFERPLLLPWTGEGFDYSCNYEHTSLVAILHSWKNAHLKLQFLESLAFGVIIAAPYMTCNKSRK